VGYREVSRAGASAPGAGKPAAMPSNERGDPDSPVDTSRGGELWTLRLYVAGRTPRSLKAFQNLKRVCEASLRARYEIDVVDLLDQPSGDLSDTNRALAGLGIQRRRAR